MLATAFERFLLAPWRRIALEAADERRAGGYDSGTDSTHVDSNGSARREVGKIDWRVPVTLGLVSLVVVFQWYVGDRDFFNAVFHKHYGHTYYYDLGSYAWWTGAKLVGYILVPLVALAAARVRLSEVNTSARGVAQHLRTYALLYVVVFPVVLMASRTHAFQATYPFYKLAARSWTDLLAWELFYASSFIALEFFYRGFVLGMLRRSLGPYAIFVMIVPYCMVHFGKPAVEAVGAIFAGIALGTLAMATRSIWGGVLIHVSIAWTMDLLAIIQTTGLPGANAAGRFVGH